MANPLHKPWTDEDVQRALDLRAAGLSFVEIAETLGRTKSSVQDKTRKLAKRRNLAKRAVVLARQVTAAPVAPPVAESRPGAEPLPAGHPITWACVCIEPEWWRARG